ncbi:hypothetical protein TTHERM_00284240 (macronuclear) [Tetrahymena thermophila SB210]|uniref:Uncharacterized protein n=1 Tax=Tetrahymena thermophila (strain SB210) TaxID=312017 RepID=I7M8G4_TETTS|nr:hypothetical protein TTHERM_00284240 [Tetrahymena thermophila SB210]EAR98032.3 hypothetical protein TTHERM_00284240 [Tetrahymena thermophila SB210]|eukprot:XP_001018277.3 hypothetical protein TTHERM_00284240 [Tetrahymena thermophila SB210]
MSTKQGNSQKATQSKSKLSSEVNISKQSKNESHSITRISDQVNTKLDQKKASKVKSDKQDIASIIFQKEKAITKLQKQLEKEKKDYEKIRQNVETNLNQHKIQAKKPRPQTASAANNSKREQNSSQKLIEEIRSQKLKSINSITSTGSANREKQLNEVQKSIKERKEQEKNKQKYENSNVNKSLTLTDYEQAHNSQLSGKGAINYNINSGYSPYDNYLKAREWDDQSALYQKIKDISQINYTPTENRSLFTTASGVKPEAGNRLNYLHNKYNVPQTNLNQSPFMQNKVLQQALSAQNQKTINELQDRLDSILKTGGIAEEQSENKAFQKPDIDNYESLDQFKIRNKFDNLNDKEQNQLYKSYEKNNFLNDNQSESEQIQQKYNSENQNGNTRNQTLIQDSIDRKVLTHSDIQQQQFSLQSFGLQPSVDKKKRQKLKYEIAPSFQDSVSNFKQSYHQSEPTSIKNGKKKMIDNEIQLYQLQNERHETEIQQLRLQVKILEKELKDKKQETLQKEIEYKAELNNLQSVLAQIDKENKALELKEQETQILIKQLNIKENEVNELRAFYEDRLQNEQQQFNSQKKIWQKIYQELQEEINILKHELNQYNVQINNESIATRHADVQYINFVEKYN